jgi:hypothetical protein
MSEKYLKLCPLCLSSNHLYIGHKEEFENWIIKKYKGNCWKCNYSMKHNDVEFIAITYMPILFKDE